VFAKGFFGIARIAVDDSMGCGSRRFLHGSSLYLPNRSFSR
jgi:hypothetical protein